MGQAFSSEPDVREGKSGQRGDENGGMEVNKERERENVSEWTGWA